MTLQTSVEELQKENNIITTTWANLRKRKGHFQVSRNLLELCDDSIFKLFGNVIIVRCEYLYYSDFLDYMGYSLLFDEVDEGITPPDYTFQFENNFDTGEVSIRAIRLP